MKLVYGLAVTLFLFEGFITQFGGVAGLTITENHIIFIMPTRWEGNEIKETAMGSDSYIEISSYDKILSTFEKNFKVIKRVKIDYNGLGEDDRQDIDGRDMCEEINKNIIKIHSGKWTELEIKSPNFLDFIDEISKEGEERIKFPNVKKFKFNGGLVIHGCDFGGSYDLHSIFPNLMSLSLHYIPYLGDHGGMAINAKSFKNIEHLTELILDIAPTSFKGEALDGILANNTGITNFAFTITDNIATIDLIVKHLENLQTLEINIDGTKFLDHIFEIKEISNIPLSKRLRLNVKNDDPRIIDFINRFKNVETVEMLSSNNVIPSNIGELKHAKEFITNGIEPKNLRDILQSFDNKNTNLRSLKLRIGNTSYNNYKNEMTIINKELKGKKPTWKPFIIKEKGHEPAHMLLTR